MVTIYKYPLKVTDEQIIENVPGVREILCVQVQNGIPCLWTKVDSSTYSRPLRVVTKGTGHPFTDTQQSAGLKYAGTYQLNEGQLVFHVFTE